jgi:hypothetical protein
MISPLSDYGLQKCTDILHYRIASGLDFSFAIARSSKTAQPFQLFGWGNNEKSPLGGMKQQSINVEGF